jgi:hypothetical protein
VLLYKAPPQCLTANQHAVLSVRERKQRQEGEGLSASGTATAPNPDPIVVFIMRLLAAASVADDRIALTNRASPQDDLGAARSPIRFELAQRNAKWDKHNRSSSGLCPPALTRQDRSRKRSPFLLKQKSNWKRIQLVGYAYLGCVSKNWPLINGQPEVIQTGSGQSVPGSRLVFTVGVI